MNRPERPDREPHVVPWHLRSPVHWIADKAKLFLLANFIAAVLGVVLMRLGVW